MNTPWATMSVGLRISRDEQLREVLVFLFLIAPSMGLSFFAFQLGSLSFRLTATATILRDLGLVSLIIFFLWRNGEPIERIGWTFTNKWWDAILGAVLFIPMFFGSASLAEVLKGAGFTVPVTHALTPKSSSEFLLAALLVLVVAVAEEIIFRGYLILRLNAVTHSTLGAAFVSSIVFSLGHGYEGTAGVITVGFMGLFFALVYLSRRSLVAPIVMHFLQDFASMIIIPIFKHHPGVSTMRPRNSLKIQNLAGLLAGVLMLSAAGHAADIEQEVARDPRESEVKKTVTLSLFASYGSRISLGRYDSQILAAPMNVPRRRTFGDETVYLWT